MRISSIEFYTHKFAFEALQHLRRMINTTGYVTVEEFWDVIFNKQGVSRKYTKWDDGYRQTHGWMSELAFKIMENPDKTWTMYVMDPYRVRYTR